MPKTLTRKEFIEKCIAELKRCVSENKEFGDHNECADEKYLDDIDRAKDMNNE